MATALQIINRAAEVIGYKDPDEALSGSDANNFLDVLNDIRDQWNTQRLYIPTVEEAVVSMSSISATIGPGQTINVTRPIRIEDGSFTRINNVDYPLTVIDREDYDALAVKTVTSTFPQYIYYDDSVPTGTVYLYPVPSSSVSLHLQLATQLSTFADLSTDYPLAQGYKKALTYSLAEEISIGRRPLDAQVVRIAAASRRVLKVMNYESPQLNESTEYMTPYMRFLAGK